MTQNKARSKDQPMPRQFQSFSEASSFIGAIADLLRGDFKQYDFGLDYRQGATALSTRQLDITTEEAA